jgi:RNA polymerase sigma-70 factor (ECF subfamily)
MTTATPGDTLRRDLSFDASQAPCASQLLVVPSAARSMDDVSEELAPLFRKVSEDDRRIIRGLLAGDPEALATLDAWILVVLRNEFHALAEEWDDLRQDIRVRIFTNLRHDRFHGESALRTYVHRIARNTGIDLWRRLATRRREAQPTDSPGRTESATADGSVAVVSRDFLRKILRGLPADDRHLLELLHGQHLSYAEVARLLGVAEGTVKARVFHCRERLFLLRRQLLRHTT